MASKVICEYYDIDGQKLDTGSFSLLTKSLPRATIDAQQITGLPLIKFANKFAVMGEGNKRLVVSVQS